MDRNAMVPWKRPCLVAVVSCRGAPVLQALLPEAEDGATKSRDSRQRCGPQFFSSDLEVIFGPRDVLRFARPWLPGKGGGRRSEGWANR